MSPEVTAAGRPTAILGAKLKAPSASLDSDSSTYHPCIVEARDPELNPSFKVVFVGPGFDMTSGTQIQGFVRRNVTLALEPQLPYLRPSRRSFSQQPWTWHRYPRMFLPKSCSR
jgi:hypothetical protein